MKSKILTLFLLMLASFTSVAQITNVELTQNEFSLIAGETAQIRMKVTANGEYRMSYNSNDQSIAQVSDDGIITAVGEGSTIIFIMGDWDNNTGQPYTTSVTVNVTMPDGMFYVDNFKCKFTDDTRSAISILGEVVQYTQVSWTLNIPATLKPVFMDADVPVTHIAESAFADCSHIGRVIFSRGEGKLTLGNRCFANIPFTSLEIDRDFLIAEDGVTAQHPFFADEETAKTEAKVTFGENMKEICSYALSAPGAGRFTTIQLGRGITDIKQYALYGTGIEEITLYGAIENIGSNAFGSCGNLKEVKLYSEALKNASIQDAFGPETLQNATLTVPAGTLSVFAKDTGWNRFHCIAESDALFTVDGLLCKLDDRQGKEGQVIIDGALFPDETGETLIIPGSLTYKGEVHPIRHIWNDAFAGNERIKRIVIQPGEEYIYLGDRCFGNVPFTSFELDRNFTWQRGQESQSPFKYEGDAPLATLILGDNMTEVGMNGFSYAGNRFDKVQMSDNITSIGYNAFGDFTNITELKLPSRLEEIGKMAFKKCSRLKSLIIPASVKSIGEYAFGSCIALETLEFDGTDDNIKIDDYAFDWCFHLKEITVHWETPVPLQVHTFSRPATDTPAALNVPEGSLRAYSRAEVWETLSFISDGTESWPHAVTVSIPDHAAFTVYGQVAPLNVNIQANDEWSIHSITHNDTDVMPQLDTEGNYTIDGAADTTNHNLNVVFEKKTPTGIGDIDNGSDNVHITVTDGIIHISGMRNNTLAELYSLDGIKIYIGNERDIHINRHGTFILCIGHHTFKLNI